MRDRKTVALLVVLLSLFALQPDSIHAGQNPELGKREVAVSDGTSTLINQDGSNDSQYNVTLWIKDWREDADKGLTVVLYDSSGKFVDGRSPNGTGHVRVSLLAGSYSVFVQSGNRTVGHQLVEVSKPEAFMIEIWAYDLTVECVDQDDSPLPDHVVFLYNQIALHMPLNSTELGDQARLLVNWTKTDGRGIARFINLWNGTYQVRVVGSEPVGQMVVDLQKPESVTVRCGKARMRLAFVTSSGESLLGAPLLIYDAAGNELRDRTDQGGFVFREGMYTGKYTIYVDWMGTQVWSGTVDIPRDEGRTISCRVYRLTVRCVDQFGNTLPKADVRLRKRIYQGPGSTGLWDVVLDLQADEEGIATVLLPPGSYEASCSYGIYSGLTNMNLNGDHVETIHCNIGAHVGFLVLFVAFPLIALTIWLERRKLRKPLEIRRYKNTLLKLESMYNSGLVEYKIYSKLREEYEAKITELGGREMR